MVGRNYTYQINGASATVWYDDRILNRFMGSGANGFCIDEFNSDNFDHSGLGFFGGGNIACNNTGARPIQTAGRCRPAPPTWGSGWKAAVKQYYNRTVSFGMQGESPAYRQNYARPRPDLPRRLRQPAAAHHLQLHRQRAEDGQVRGREGDDADRAGDGARRIQQVNDTITDFNIVPYQSTHISGGTIMGDDPTHLGRQQVRPGLGHAQPVRRRRQQLPPERRLQPDRHRRRARVSTRRCDRHQVPAQPRHARLTRAASGDQRLLSMSRLAPPIRHIK